MIHCGLGRETTTMSSSTKKPPSPSQSDQDSWRSSNREYWAELAALHGGLDEYGVQILREGGSTLRSIELGQLGELRGKSVLNLQCHIGLDAMSLARAGALVTGIDFCQEAIDWANREAGALGLSAQFHCMEYSDVPEKLNRTFDIVLASYGILVWLPSVREWMQIVQPLVNPGGLFLIVDEHPFAAVFSGDKSLTDLKPEVPYAESGEPYITHNRYSYAAESITLSHQVQYKWPHGLGELVNAVVSTGMTIEALNEYHCCHYEILAGMTRKDDGFWYLQDHPSSIPLLFSLLARKQR